MARGNGVRWAIAMIAALAIIALLAYARGPRDGLRRDPSHGTLGAPALVHHVSSTGLT